MAVSTFPALRMASTRQKGHSLVRRVRVTICLPMRGWWFFGGSGGFGGRLLQRMVPDSGACSTRAVAVAGNGVS
jgi:hypothetical protein